jgi:DNA-binding FadR family transcriptional regulator
MSPRIAGRRTTVVLKPATRVPLSQVVLDQVLAQIRDGSLRPGDRLPSEYELMRMLGVGRSSVREALRGLISLGLVDTRPGRGAVVLSRASSPLEHRAIVEAIRRRQPGRARRAVIQHIRRYAAMVRRLGGEDPPAVLAGPRRARSAGGPKVQTSARHGSP